MGLIRAICFRNVTTAIFEMKINVFSSKRLFLEELGTVRASATGNENVLVKGR